MIMNKTVLDCAATPGRDRGYSRWALVRSHCGYVGQGQGPVSTAGNRERQQNVWDPKGGATCNAFYSVNLAIYTHSLTL